MVRSSHFGFLFFYCNDADVEIPSVENEKGNAISDVVKINHHGRTTRKALELRIRESMVGELLHIFLVYVGDALVAAILKRNLCSR